MNTQRRLWFFVSMIALIAPHVGFGAETRTEMREPGAFSRIVVEGPFDVELRQAARETLTLRADGDVIPLIETEVTDSTLHLRLRKDTMLRNLPKIQVSIDVVRLQAISLGGAGSIVSKGLTTEKLQVSLGGMGIIDLAGVGTDELGVSLGGNGRIHLGGRTASLKVSIAGHGDCDTNDLVANDVVVSIAGHGNAHVRADKALKVSIAGNGNVVYRGDAALSTSVVGNGRVKKA